MMDLVTHGRHLGKKESVVEAMELRDIIENNNDDGNTQKTLFKQEKALHAGATLSFKQIISYGFHDLTSFFNFPTYYQTK